MTKSIVYKGYSIKYNVKSMLNRLIYIKIWDTAGQEKYHSLAPMYYRGIFLIFTRIKKSDADVTIFTYDITSKSSFNVLKTWVKEVNEKC